MEKPDSIKQKEADLEVRKKVLEMLKDLSDKTDNEFEKNAYKDIAKDIVEAPDMRWRLELSHKEIEEDWRAMF